MNTIFYKCHCNTGFLIRKAFHAHASIYMHKELLDINTRAALVSALELIVLYNMQHVQLLHSEVSYSI